MSRLWIFTFALAGCTQAAQSPQEGTTTSQQAVATAAPSSSEGPHGPCGAHGRPPQAAFDACTSKAVGDTCSVTIDERVVDGTCVSPPSGAPDSAAFCAPPHPQGGPPHGPPPPEVFAACDGKTEGAACSVTFGDKTVDGTCRTPPAGVTETRLGCAPAR